MAAIEKRTENNLPNYSSSSLLYCCPKGPKQKGCKIAQFGKRQFGLKGFESDREKKIVSCEMG